MEVEAASGTNVEAGSPLRKLISVASIAAGVQFGWALQLSLLTPYVQLLGIPHKWSSLIWLCGPISGLVVQPIAGFYSDRCTSRFGRRKPFIAVGTILVALAIILIGFAADFGRLLGDPVGNEIKTRAIGLFVLGFWVLDVANNTLQGPCRAFLADLSGSDHKKTRTANAFFSFFMAVGNVLGYAAGSYSKLYHMAPFTKTAACDVYCANLKSCFFISIVLLLVLTVIALCYVTEKPLSTEEAKALDSGGGNFFTGIFGALRHLEKPMWILLLVTCLNWLGWFAFLLFDTDWVGREVYGGKASGNAEEVKAYNNGVHYGALALMVNAVVLAVMSLGIEPIGRLLGGVKNLWGVANFILAICLAMTLVVNKQAKDHFTTTVDILTPPTSVKAGALAVFGALGIPQAVTFSVPFALASIFCKTSSDKSTAGQGLSLGVLNLAIVLPQMFVSSIAGPLDDAFGGGNAPAFVFGAVAATLSGIVAIFVLPSPPPGDSTKNVAGGFH